LRILAIDFDPSDLEVHCSTVIEAKFPLEIDFDQRPAMGFFGLVQLIPAKTPRVLAVVKLVNR
jgi:hypothetical protein